VEEGGQAEWAADRLGGAQRGDLGGLRLLCDESGEATASAFDERRDFDQPVVAAGKMGADARPWPVLGPGDEFYFARTGFSAA
jgi:hypothetical protein